MYRLIWRSVALATLATRATAQPTATWTLTETLRIGGGDTGPTSFNYIKSIAVDDKGRIFVYDRQAKDIRVFAADGKFVKTIGRVGSGPGELRDAEGIAFAPNGDLWMRDAANARFTVFDGEGRYKYSWTVTFCTSQGPWDPQMDRNGRLLDVDCMVRNGQGNAYVLLGYRLDRSRIDTIADRPPCGTPQLAEAARFVTKSGTRTTYRSIPFAPTSLKAFGPSGEWWCVANSEAYQLTRVVPGERDTVRVARAAERTPLSATERDDIMRQFGVNTPGGMELGRVPGTKPAIDRIVADADGRLWVMRSLAKSARQLDVIDAKGRLAATATLGTIHTSNYTPFIVKGEHIYLVVVDDDDVPFVSRFRITK